MTKVVIIGYSGHSFVVCDIFKLLEFDILGYFELNEMDYNPFNLTYLGSESTIKVNDERQVFVAIGNNAIRERIAINLEYDLVNAIHPNAVIADSVIVGLGVLVSANAVINSLSTIGNGAIINTGVIIEHECKVGAFAHIAPGAVLAGNVRVGDRSFIGANSVVKQGVVIGNDVIVGAGSVILNDVPDNVTIVGNPGRIIN